MNPAASPSLDALADRHYAAGDFTRKGSTYLASYQRLLEDRREARLSILELGVSSGARDDPVTQDKAAQAVGGYSAQAGQDRGFNRSSRHFDRAGTRSRG